MTDIQNTAMRQQTNHRIVRAANKHTTSHTPAWISAVFGPCHSLSLSSSKQRCTVPIFLDSSRDTARSVHEAGGLANGAASMCPFVCAIQHLEKGSAQRVASKDIVGLVRRTCLIRQAVEAPRLSVP